MRKSRIFILVLTLIMVLSIGSIGFAGKSTLSCEKIAKPTVAVLVINNAKTDFDDAITKQVTDGIMAKLDGLYRVAPLSALKEKFAKAGIIDLATAEKEDLAKVLRADGIRYLVYAEIEPFVRKERFTVFSHGLDMTAVVPFRITDIGKNENLYIGKFVEIAKETAPIGFGFHNQTIALQAIDKVVAKISDTLTARLPL